jgi:hypothetical protein
MDADLQDSPDEIPELYRRIVEEKYDLISGWKAKRYDPLSKTIPTKLFNCRHPQNERVSTTCTILTADLKPTAKR